LNKYDKVAIRLAQILQKLNNGELFTINELIKEFGVTKRTIQRDINERLSYLPIKINNGKYYLEDYYLGKLSLKDIKSFASLSGIKQLFPEFDDEFIKNILDDKVAKAYLIKTHNYEDISLKKELFESIEKAIINQNIIKFIYNDKKRVLNPYKLLNTKGVWYVVGVENEKLNTFTFSKIEKCEVTNDNFEIEQKYIKIIENEDTNWFGKHIEVVLKVSKNVANYFLRRKIFPNQELIKELEDKNILISCKVAYEEEILRLVRYWIPNVEIVSPDNIRVKLEDGLKEYLKIKFKGKI
jgi:predicted DNA-binding transcriptional regulator YafY